MKFLINLICAFIPKKQLREKIRAYLVNYFWARDIILFSGCKNFKTFQIIHQNLGEVVIFCLTLRLWYKGGMILVTKPYHKELFTMFYPDLPCKLVKRPNYCYIDYKEFHYRDYQFSYVLTSEKLREMNLTKENFYINWQEYTGGKIICNDFPEIKISKEVKESAERKLKKLKINIDKLIFISPEAITMKPLPEEFWDKIISLITDNGYSTFINISTGLDYEVLSLEEAYYVASKSKMLIGLRSGLIDLLCLVKVPLRIIYTESDFYGDIQSMYSLYKYPYCYDDLREFNLFNMSINKILEDIEFDIINVVSKCKEIK